MHGRKAEPDEAPIVVSNHISFVETIYLPARFFCMAVSAAENAKFPVRAAHSSILYFHGLVGDGAGCRSYQADWLINSMHGMAHVDRRVARIDRSSAR